MKFNVTQVHIDKGEKRGGHTCPTALAIMDKIPYSRPLVSQMGIWLTYQGQLHRLSTPLEVECFINAFDAGQTIQPFTFTLPI